MADFPSSLFPQSDAGPVAPRGARGSVGDASNVAGFNPAMLSTAREARHLTRSALAREMGVGQPLVAGWETPAVPGHDAQRPSREQVERLAALLDFHPSVFFTPGAGPSVSASEFFHRALAKAKLSDLRAAHARCNVAELQVGRLLELCPTPEDRIPDIDPDNHAGDVERIAGWARARMGVPVGPVDDLVAVIESCGGVVVDRDLEIDGVDALCRWTHGLPKLFFLNGGRSADRMRLSLAHELGHTVMHFNRDVDPALAERQAKDFAAAFLLPAADFRRDLGPRLDLAKLAGLKRKWRVSMQAIAYRAHRLGAIDGRQFRSLFQQLAGEGWRKTEPVDIRPESPTAFKRMLRAHLDAGHDRDRLAAMLFVNRRWLDSMLVDAASPDWADAGVRMRLVR